MHIRIQAYITSNKIYHLTWNLQCLSYSGGHTSSCSRFFSRFTDVCRVFAGCLWSNIVGTASMVSENLGFVYKCGAIEYLGSINRNRSSKWYWQILALFAGWCTKFSLASHKRILSPLFHGRLKKEHPGSFSLVLVQPGAQHVGILSR